MINTPTYQTFPVYGSTAVKATTGLDTANLYPPGVLLPAEHLNYYVNGFTNNGSVSQLSLLSMLAEMQQMVTGVGFALDPTDNMQMEKSNIARRHEIGSLVYSETELTPVIYSAARSTTNPSNPAYLPLIKRYDTDHTVTSTQAPDLVTQYRAEPAKINIAGSIVSSWTGTVSGSTITFASNATNLALINMYFYEAQANAWIQTQSAAFTTLYTGTAQRCINVAGTDYAVTAVSPGAYTITVSGTPTTGSQTCIPYTYRIAGSSTSILLPRISGFVGVVAQDYDGEINAGWRKMDRQQGHYMAPIAGYTSFIGNNNPSGAFSSFGAGSAYGQAASTGSPITDGTNGTPRTGKTNDPRTLGLYVYTHAGRLLA